MKKVGSFLLIFAICLMSIANFNVKTASAETKDGDNMFIETPYKIDDVYKMNMDEYYQNLFPEIYSSLSNEDVEYLKTITYGDLKGGLSNDAREVVTVKTTANLYRSGNLLLSYKVDSKTTNGMKLDEISHAITLVDHNGRVWLTTSDSAQNKSSLTSTGSKGGNPASYQLQVVTRGYKTGYTSAFGSVTTGWVYN